MITSIKFKSGYPVDLPAIGKQKFDFTPGLNILWGPNGCGKTTLLATMAAYGFVKGGGWSTLHEPVALRGFALKPQPNLAEKDFPKILAAISPGKAVAEMKWDRAPVFFANGNDHGAGHLVDSASESPDGLTGIVGQVTQIMAKRSSGQTRCQKLLVVGEHLQKGAPDFRNIKLKPMNDIWRDTFQAQINFLSKRPDDGRLTVLFDEPDRSLDLATQMNLWRKYLPETAKRVQVVVATHSPFAFVHKDANWISFGTDIDGLRKDVLDYFA